MVETITAAKPQMQRRGHAESVTVACNLPNGIILQLYDVELTETVLPNGRVIKENQCTLRTDQQWALRGPVNRSALAATNRDDVLPDDYVLVRSDAPDAGYALTFGVPKDFWEEWLRINQNNPLVKNGHVFAAKSESDAKAMAKEHREFTSGFQGLNQSGDYRVPNGKAIRKFDRADARTTAEVSDEE
jgi:hypothetical protein